MKIGVSGASGHLGRAVVSELLQRRGGHEVAAITRTPETVAGPARGRFGDYNRPESLAEAYAGLDRLLIIPSLDAGKRGAQNVAIAENRVAFVARGDVAAAAAGILIGDCHAGATYNATGPERLSGAERAALVAEITGRPLAFLVITEEQLRAGLTQASLPAQVVNTVISIQASFAAGAFDIMTGDVERLGGRPPKPLRDVLAGALKFPSA